MKIRARKETNTTLAVSCCLLMNCRILYAVFSDTRTAPNTTKKKKLI